MRNKNDIFSTASLKSATATNKNRRERRSAEVPLEIARVFFVLAATACVSFVLIFAINFLVSMPYFIVQEVVARGCNELTQKEIVAIAGVNQKQSIFSVKKDEIEKRVKNNPWVREAFVGREFPNRLVIEVKERAPIAMLRSDNGTFLLDETGVVFKPVSLASEVNVPVLTGDYKQHNENPALYAKTQALFRSLSKSADYPRMENVSEICVDEVIGFSLVTDNGLYVKVGYDDYEKKFNNLRKIINYYKSMDKDVKFLSIDLRDLDRAFISRQSVITNNDTSTAGTKRRLLI